MSRSKLSNAWAAILLVGLAAGATGGVKITAAEAQGSAPVSASTPPPVPPRATPVTAAPGAGAESLPPASDLPPDFSATTRQLHSIDCQRVIQALDLWAKGQGTGSQGILDILPRGSRLIPYPPSNSLIIISSPPGVAKVQELLARMDRKPQPASIPPAHLANPISPIHSCPFILIQMVKVILSANESKALGLNYQMATPLGQVDTTRIGLGKRQGSLISLFYLGNHLQKTLSALENSPRTRVTARPRVILPNGAFGWVMSQTDNIAILPGVTSGFGATLAPPQPIEIPNGFSFGFSPRLNQDGTITIFSQIQDPAAITSIPVSGAAINPQSPVIPLPGLRIVNGDTIAIASVSDPKSRQDQSKIPVLGDLPVFASLFCTAKGGDANYLTLYFITPNLVDEHGQIIPGGAEAVKKAMEINPQPTLPEPISDPGQAKPAPGPISPGFVKEMVPLKFQDCQQVIQSLDLWAPGQGTGSQGILDILPRGSRLIPYSPSNSLIIISSPAGVARVQELLARIDRNPQFIYIQGEEVVVNQSDLKALGLDRHPVTPLLRINDPTILSHQQPGAVDLFYVGSNFQATLSTLENSPRVRVIARPRVILPNGVFGWIQRQTDNIAILPGVTTGFGATSTPLQPIEIPDRFSPGFVPRLNTDGTITIFSQIQDPAAIIGISAYARALTPPSPGDLPLPGLRIVNGDTIAIAVADPKPGQDRNKISVLGDLAIPGVFPTTSDIDANNLTLYFITPHLVDEHGQIIPGGAEAVKKAMEINPQPTLPEPISDSHKTNPAPGPISPGFVEEMVPLQHQDCRQLLQNFADMVNDSDVLTGTQGSPQKAGSLPSAGAPGTDSSLPGEHGGRGHVTALADLLPEGSRVIPYTPANSLIVISTPDGIGIARRLVHQLDQKPISIMIELEKLAAPQSLLSSLFPFSRSSTTVGSTPAGTHPGASTSTIVSISTAAIRQLEASSQVRVLARPRIILPDGVSGSIYSIAVGGKEHMGSGTSSQPGPASGYSINLRGRVNQDGTITLYSVIKELSGQKASLLASNHPDHVLSIPGLRLNNGESVLVKAEDSENASPQISPTPTTAGDRAASPVQKDPEMILYLIKPTLVDEHGQALPDGPRR